MQFKKIAFFIISVILLITGCDSKNDEKKETIEKKQTKFVISSQITPTITLEKIDNGIDFKEFKGKVVLLNFFATWCPPCRAEIPHLNNLQKKYKDSFEVIALNMGEQTGGQTPKEKIDEFIHEHSISYNVSNEETNFKISDMIGNIKVIPTMFLYDTKGKLVQKYVGIVPEEMMETDIKRALGK
ncbi:TlpA family protein disulfide reductase [Halarcobacter anaerophilus]|jgi:thiol-disulfide isomerase/thioredoxin|uniref:TlpA family protein disulfide reductase n=1 Tax=Halarcobacter anaerophilus TaxID=877500 RepID=UPI0005C90AB8|nr:TlpA disulfide reductase family protein [Halarcobacter anaerophilus]